MKRAGVDIDGVLYDWDTASRALLAERWGVSLPISISYYATRDALCERLGTATGNLAWSWLFTAPAQQAGLWRWNPMPGVFEALNRLRLHFEVAIITKRPRIAAGDTFRWFVDRGFTPDSLTLLEPSSGRSKAEVPCDWYVDDSPAIVEDLAKQGKRVYLFDQPWNQGCEAGERVADWDDLLRKVQGTR